MNWKLAAGILFAAFAQIALADSTVQQAQETLKEQGFYYGQITGQKNADTTAAIRRFQIRNGLQVTGDLNEETLRALNSNSSATVQTATPPPPPRQSEIRPQPEEDNDSHSEVPVGPPAVSLPPPKASYQAPPQEPARDVFGDTPYATAPPQLQRQLLLGVETNLLRRGLYRGEVDGAFGPELEAALRAYQSRLGLLPSGRLDMDTLASLGLLPGQRAPRSPRWRYPGEQPVRGEWIH